MTLDKLDTFSASCLSDPRIHAPVTTNNLSKLRSWARFEDYLSLTGGGLITVWNPWATENPTGASGCWNGGSVISTCGVKEYPDCSAGVNATVESWLADVPAIVANLRADGPWSDWSVDPILCQIGYWIHGVECAAPYSGWVGASLSTATTGDPNPAYGCPNLTSTSPPPSPLPYQPPPSTAPGGGVTAGGALLVLGSGALLAGWAAWHHPEILSGLGRAVDGRSGRASSTGRGFVLMK